MGKEALIKRESVHAGRGWAIFRMSDILKFSVDRGLGIRMFAGSRHLVGGPAEMLSGFGFFQG